LRPAGVSREYAQTHLGCTLAQCGAQLSGLFAMDAFAGGLVVQSMVAYWFSIKFHVQPGIIGSIFFGANVLAGFSA